MQMSEHNEALVAKAAEALDEHLDYEPMWSRVVMARAVLDAVADDLRAEALREAADERLAYSRELREAFRKHNANRDLSRMQPRRPDLRNWADAHESTAHWLRSRADRIEAPDA